MFKIRGKAYIIFFLMNISIVYGKVIMRALTTNGEPLEMVGMGQPFTIEIVADGGQSASMAPSIDGIEKFFVKRTGMYMSSINGISTTKFSYQVRIDEPGIYTIGPAHVKPYNQQSLTSNVITVRVGTEENVLASMSGKEKKTKPTQTDSKVFLRLHVDKEHVVVGQKITGTLQLFYRDPEMQLVHIGKPDIAGFDMKQVGAPQGGYMEINGVQYRYAEWKWDMYPTVAGEYIFPAYSADYELPDKEKKNHGGLFMFFNTSRVERKRIYSNAVKINVAPLPHYDGYVDAVGTFERITISIKPPVAKVGEGMVLTLEIEGDCNWDSLDAPTLSIPSELKYYHSEKNQEETKKRFEFVIQGLQSGDWEIPEQAFTFFDTKKMTYQTIYSSSLLVTVIPNNEIHIPEGNDYTIMHNDIGSESRLEIGIHPLNERGCWYPVQTISLSRFIMQIIMMLPVLLGMSLFMRKKIGVLQNNNVYFRKKRALKRAKKALDVCSLTGDASQLYGVFRQLFLDCYGQSFDVNIDTIIKSSFVNNRMSEDERKEWEDFLVAITQAAFGSSGNNYEHGLCQVAYVWINRLKKII